jgi:RNA polymerase sigma-70 factor (ECF subfamily)
MEFARIGLHLEISFGAGCGMGIGKREMNEQRDFGDRRLALRLADHDEVALQVLMTRQNPKLLALASHVLNDRDVAEDIVCQAWERIWARRECESTEDVEGYLCRTVKNLLLDRLRSRKARRSRERRWQNEAPVAASSSDAHTECVSLYSSLIDEILDLPARRCDALLLVHFWGLTHAEAGERLGVSPRTIENHVAAARRSLRERFGEYLE